MTYRDAVVLLDVAAMVSADRYGTKLSAIEQRIGKHRRSLQRLLVAMRSMFPDMEEFYDDDRHKRVRLRRPALCDLAGVSAEQLAALDLAVEALDVMNADAKPLLRLRDDVRSQLSDAVARRLDPDADALLEAQGLVAHPGPRQLLDPHVDEAIARALKECRFLEFDYTSGAETRRTKRCVAPYGILSGLRRYLVGQPADKPAEVRTYRLDKVVAVAVTGEGFVRPPEFDLHAFARRSFGASFCRERVPRGRLAVRAGGRGRCAGLSVPSRPGVRGPERRFARRPLQGLRPPRDGVAPL